MSTRKLYRENFETLKGNAITAGSSALPADLVSTGRGSDPNPELVSCSKFKTDSEDSVEALKDPCLSGRVGEIHGCIHAEETKGLANK